MKKLLFLLMLPLVLALSGCDDDGRQKVNPKKLEGIWEVYDASGASTLGLQLTFFNDGRMIIKDMLQLGASIDLYEISGKNIKCGMKYRSKGGLWGEYTMSFEKGGLYLNEIKTGNDVFWVKLKKVEELPCDA